MHENDRVKLGDSYGPYLIKSLDLIWESVNSVIAGFFNGFQKRGNYQFGCIFFSPYNLLILK